MTKEDYLKEITEAVREVQEKLQFLKYNVTFGGEGDKPKRIHVPTEARSEFLSNQALGDWAEKTLAKAIRRESPKIGVAHYGESDKIAAGDDGFPEFYKKRVENVRKFGKRPDLILLSNTKDIEMFENYDVSNEPTEALSTIAKKANCAIEVRSSKVEALKYMELRKWQEKNNKLPKKARLTPSFTVKVEDLVIVYRWLEQNNVPQTYCQVFFDSIWAINVLDIFKWMSKNEIKIEKHNKSQGKATIFLPITEGEQIGKFLETPKLEIMPKISKLWRHDSYIVPKENHNDLELNMKLLEKIMLP